jgi:anti-sigma-K factor RskA
MSDNERIEELISAYTLGILDGDDLIEAENYIKSNPDKYKKLIEENEIAISQTAHALKRETPRPELKDKLLSEIKPTPKIIRQDTRVSSWQRFNPLALGFAVASIAIIISLITYIYSIDSRFNEQQARIAELETLVSEKDSELALLREEFGEQGDKLAFLENPEVVVINLVKTEPDLKAVGRVLWNPDNDEAMFYALELPETPEGKTYQLWAISEGQPISAGVFSVDESGNNVHLIKSLKDLGKVSAFAVSVEPEGGVKLPSGKIVLMGEI